MSKFSKAILRLSITTSATVWINPIHMITHGLYLWAERFRIGRIINRKFLSGTSSPLGKVIGKISQTPKPKLRSRNCINNSQNQFYRPRNSQRNLQKISTTTKW
jgi:hypothetical protein